MRKVMVKDTALWEFMAKHNLSQKELARKLGISQGYASQLVCGVRCPSPRLRRTMLEVMSPLSFEQLFSIEAAETEA